MRTYFRRLLESKPDEHANNLASLRMCNGRVIFLICYAARYEKNGTLFCRSELRVRHLSKSSIPRYLT